MLATDYSIRRRLSKWELGCNLEVLLVCLDLALARYGCHSASSGPGTRRFGYDDPDFPRILTTDDFHSDDLVKHVTPCRLLENHGVPGQCSVIVTYPLYSRSEYRSIASSLVCIPGPA